MKFTLTLPISEVAKTKEQIIKQAAEEVTVKGFRKGKAPLDKAKAQLDEEKINQEVISQLLTPKYIEYIEDNKLQPITNPKITLKKMSDSDDWEFEVEIAEKPEVKLNDYQDAIKSVQAKSQIWTPEKGDKEEKQDLNENQKREQKLQEILKTLLDTCEVDIPNILIEDDVNRSMARLVDQVQNMGMSVEDYLKAQNLTHQKLRKRYEQSAKENLQLELILDAIAQDLDVKVKSDEIEKAYKQAVSQEDESPAQEQEQRLKILIETQLTKQKTIDKLMTL